MPQKILKSSWSDDLSVSGLSNASVGSACGVDLTTGGGLGACLGLGEGLFGRLPDFAMVCCIGLKTAQDTDSLRDARPQGAVSSVRHAMACPYCPDIRRYRINCCTNHHTMTAEKSKTSSTNATMPSRTSGRRRRTFGRRGNWSSRFSSFFQTCSDGFSSNLASCSLKKSNGSDMGIGGGGEEWGSGVGLSSDAFGGQQFFQFFFG